MAPTGDEMARRRAVASRHPSVFPPPALPTLRPSPEVDALLRRCAVADAALAEARRDLVRLEGCPDRPLDAAVLGLRLAAGRDRVTAAEDRLMAARDRVRAARALLLAHRDRLTGALQRDVGWDHLQREFDRAVRETAPLVVAFVDLDGLKLINDTQGHAAGDEALRAVGLALRESLRSYDVVVRFGGDEFVCALPGLVPPDAAERFCEVSSSLDVLCPGTRISVGLSQVLPGDDLAMLLRRADADLYAGRAARTSGAV